ncbi:MAG TPA: rhodanese-like domain-containing protein [Candidatus Udaeobacter sp.]|nr:rhodanese-like domain-containing protein [Candidatus Udaeobacter sp.]
MKFSLARQALILATVSLVPGMGQAIYLRDKISWQSPIPPSQMVSVDQARQLGGTVIWVDARPDVDFARDHVPGAILLNEDHWNELLPQLLAAWSPDKKVVVYCSAQSCDLAREVAERLRKEAQLPDVFVLEGGWEAWLKKNR